MTNEQAQVRAWMIAYEQDAPSRPKMPDETTRLLRAKLIYEEACECLEALGCYIQPDGYTRGTIQLSGIKEPNMEALADGLADLHYVAYCGTAVACGIDMEPVFAEVHRSNINKFWTNAEVAKQWGYDLQLVTQNSIGKSIMEIDNFTLKKVSKTHWLVKDASGKVIKSPSWHPPDISAAIAKGTPPQ